MTVERIVSLHCSSKCVFITVTPNSLAENCSIAKTTLGNTENSLSTQGNKQIDQIIIHLIVLRIRMETISNPLLSKEFNSK